MRASQYSLALPDAALVLGWPSILAAIATLVVVHRVVYALFFSPLRHIPGPFLARLTGKRADIIGLLGQTVKYSSKETERYGDIYVYRPNAVVISHPADIRAVYRSHNFRKTEFYRGVDLQRYRDYVQHTQPRTCRSKVEPILAMHGPESLKAKWDALLAQSTDGSVEINYNKDFLLATFDTMQFTGVWTVHWSTGQGRLDNFLNIFPFSTLLYPWKHGYDEVTRYTVESVNMRHEYLTTHKDKPVDILQVFVDAEDPQSKTQHDLSGKFKVESLNTLLAGSEAVATTMMWTVHLLMLHPEHYRRAVDEVRGEFGLDHLVTSVSKRIPSCRSWKPVCSSPCGFTQHPAGCGPGKCLRRAVTLQGHFLPGGTEIFT
ncbi:cytochrome P450 [Linderina pennispora]|uniref:Cytochrome P450 n=1 Tax=Linderina pennispora TaxID=61395 RepID=A0A1Y1WE65_9FUNG|nr:cytochrome P450 [Linderina pennispora]ORX71820.1 cytochrome P450 [Linderina pennispora]